ncbi:MAG: PilZ domain-containing protein [Myxococcales bacterium]|nr:PilZ domain-containing protein [Myxococcales bacterium]
MTDGLAVNQNISASGMLLALSARLKEGEAVTVDFSVPPDGQARSVHGIVVRVEENRDDPDGVWPFRIGVEFSEVDAELVPLLERAAAHLHEMK